MFDIHPATPADAGEVFTLQRAAFVDEAQAFGDPFVLPLTESLERVERLLGQEDTLALKAVSGARLVGTVRARVMGTSAVIGRLAVAPDLRRRGIARALLAGVEERLRERHPHLAALTLSTGAQEAGQQRLYRGLGYAETSRERVADHLVMVHMRKELAPDGSGGGGVADRGAAV
ncbi:GCN5 family acetyltransferase [Nocardiopsis sp. TSRI0078]|uniref:GNAT family N-acetyltransferase n=1 Tax=unclassified Nocardiopsis TaxID=2649073 RepID=UPI0009401D34|nr:GNAT family N-acetyltransferase [Nocardiopsis sp. TSRI0078]OKI20214.1 GCN5 family acetyltransferase [Nocardiopsis sp. TSRI0078]